MDLRPVGVFDSGLGGLTAVKKIIGLLPGEDIIYLGDTGRVPYGGRSRETIIRYALEDTEFLCGRDIKALVVACGTVSTNAMDDVVKAASVPVFGVVDSAVKKAAAVTKNGKIGILGTKATVKSGVFEEKLCEIIPEAEVTKQACPLFVPLVENGKTSTDDTVLRSVAEEYLAPLKAAGVDTVILGCTHYPIIAKTIQMIMGDDVVLVDPGAETAAELAKLLEKEDMLSGKTEGTCKYYVTDSSEGFAESASLFLGMDVKGDVCRVSLGE